jgi:subtilisin family serine protease
VAIVDGGVFGAHPDLAPNIDGAAARSFVPCAEVDPATVPMACTDVVPWDHDHDPYNFWHGTHVAGIVAAAHNDGGVIGIAPEATLVPVKVLHAGSGEFSWVIDGIIYAATIGRADVINLSLGALLSRNEPGIERLIRALNRAIDFAASRGVLVVSAAGNDAVNLDLTRDLMMMPAENGSALGIAATGPKGWAQGVRDFQRVASYTNYGNSVIDFAAPGGDYALPSEAGCTVPIVGGAAARPCWVFDLVLSTARGGWAWAGGTSMATPAAAAVAALIKQKYPDISVGQWRARLAQSASDEGRAGNDPYYGRGFLNARRAVE